MRRQFILVGILLLFFTFTIHAQLSVFYKCGETAMESPMIKPFINIINTGTTSVELKDVTIRYFYSTDGITQQRFQIDFAVLGASNIELVFEDGYFEMGFPGVNMVIPPGGETGEIQIRINKLNWSNYDQSNDFSFNPLITSYKEYSKIALYYTGTVIWGTEHYTNPSPTPQVPEK